MKNTMKLFTCIVCSLIAMHAQSQIVKTIHATKDTLVMADTAYASVVITDNVKSVEAWAKKDTGTVAGIVYFIATVDGSNYDKLDSMIVNDVDEDQFKVFPITDLHYAVYRLQYLSTGGAWRPRAYMLKR